MIELSPRLSRVADFLPKSGRFADIGSDHAYLPIYMVLNFPDLSAIAGEVVQGPFEAARQSVAKYEVEPRVTCRLGNGLDVIQPGEVQAVSICGMGGGTIREILERSRDKVEQLEMLVLQPNTQAVKVREWSINSGWLITEEDIVEDAGIYYDVLQLTPGVYDEPLANTELFFGKLNLNRRHPLLARRIEEELERCDRTLSQLQKATMTQEIEQKRENLELWQRELIHLDKFFNS